MKALLDRPGQNILATNGTPSMECRHLGAFFIHDHLQGGNVARRMHLP
jgi:hypothetical protein